jgi:Asp-tRNA(Asn)/Glu-tRNA(Gln) amidotransferase A subunit family amidase
MVNLNSDDYQRRLAGRVSLGQAIWKVMDNRLDAIASDHTRRIAPAVGGNQIGSNAGLSAQTGFPAMSVPAGFTPGGFPVGLELLGRPFAEPTLIGSPSATSRPRTPPPAVERTATRRKDIRARRGGIRRFR